MSPVTPLGLTSQWLTFLSPDPRETFTRSDIVTLPGTKCVDGLARGSYCFALQSSGASQSELNIMSPLSVASSRIKNNVSHPREEKNENWKWSLSSFPHFLVATPIPIPNSSISVLKVWEGTTQFSIFAASWMENETKVSARRSKIQAISHRQFLLLFFLLLLLSPTFRSSKFNL